MKAGTVPHEDINSRNHGIKIKTTLVRYSVQPEPPQKSPRQEPCLVISSGVLVEKNTSIGVFYYCLTEKLVIALADKSNMLNKGSEIIPTCPHRSKYRYHKVTKVQMKSCGLALCTQYRLSTLNVHSELDIATMYIMLLTDCHMSFYTRTLYIASALTSGMFQHNHHAL